MSNVIWVDEQDAVLGEVTRQKAHEEGLLHRLVAIYLLNDKNDILVHERTKDGHLDHSSAGHVDVGESYLEAAKRELEEELGVAGAELQEIGVAKSKDTWETGSCSVIFRVFICWAAPITLKADEVKSVYWADPKEVLEDMRAHPEKYTNGFKNTLKLFLEKQW